MPEVILKEIIQDLENVLFDLTQGNVYPAMKDLSNIIKRIRSLNNTLQVRRQNEQR